MQITRTETPTGGTNRTRREEIVQLFTGPREVEPECYLDCSESEGWPWSSDPALCTWAIQLEAARQFIVPFEDLDSQAADEQKGGSDKQGGVYFYPFSNTFLRLGEDDDDGDLNSANFERKMRAFMDKYFDKSGKPCGGTEIMAAVRVADSHFFGTEKKPGEFFSKPRDERPVRARVVWTDGQLNDDGKFRAYLSQATPTPEGYGSHGEWDEVWAVAIIGEPGSDAGKAAYEQYVQLAKDHPWIHPYYFEGVTNPAEIAEDMAVAVAPQD
jgi:hypothetical protein